MPRAKTQRKSKVNLVKVAESEIVTDKAVKPVTKKKPTAKKAEVVENKKTEQIDLEQIKAQLTEQIKAEVKAEYKRQMQAEAQIARHDANLERSKLVLRGETSFTMSNTEDGLQIADNKKPLLTFKNTGAAGFGISSPRTHGPGSVHIRANYSSEASIPTTGKYVTRGLIVEGDADDDSTFGLRVLSRKNRQGLNVTGDGKLRIGIINDNTKSKVSVYQPDHEGAVISGYAPSRYYNNNLMNLSTAATSTDAFNFINATNQRVDELDVGQQVFTVTGSGRVQADGAYVSNGSSYAEMFEWADGNNRNEDRIGFTVALDAKGKLRVADEGDNIVGVVIPAESAAVIGGAQWNYWKNKYTVDEKRRNRKLRYHVIEWENADNTLESYFNSTAPADADLPESAVTYETDTLGNDMYVNYDHPSMDYSKDYTARLNRREWTTVAITGTVLMFAGQFVNSNWVKIKNITDDLELWLIR